MPRQFAPELNDIKRSDLAGMSREELEELAWRLHELARSLANRAGEDSSTSSRPPSSDDPYRREERGKPVAADPDGAAAESSDAAPEKAGKPDKTKTGKSAGKQPGAKGHWRCQPIVVSAEVEHAPMVCAACGAALGPDLKRRCVSAHNSLELVRGDMALQVTATRHVYFAVRCPCGHDNVERPRVGLSSVIEGRKRNLQMSERCLVGPMLATFIAALSLRCRLSRRKIQEFLLDWLGLELGRGDHRALRPRIRPGQRTRGRATHPGGSRGRDRPSRRDPLVSEGAPALDVGGGDGAPPPSSASAAAARKNSPR